MDFNDGDGLVAKAAALARRSPGSTPETAAASLQLHCSLWYLQYCTFGRIVLSCPGLGSLGRVSAANRTPARAT